MGRTEALVIGTRKAGTTWLYHNFKEDISFNVSLKVKESGYFAGTNKMSKTYYDRLYTDDDKAIRVEVDSSICSSDLANSLVFEYNKDMRLILVLREPAEFLVSRYLHGLRKGELLEDNLSDALEKNPWLRDELDYSKMLGRFKYFIENNNLLLISFEMLQSNPQYFYDKVADFAAKKTKRSPYVIQSDVINPSRLTKNVFVTKSLSLAAQFARKYGFHELVNGAKKLGIHNKFEKKHDGSAYIDQLKLEALDIVKDDFKESIRIYKQCNVKR